MSEEANTISIITTELTKEIQGLKNENEQQALLINLLKNKENEKNRETDYENGQLQLIECANRLHAERLLKEQALEKCEKISDQINFFAEQSQDARDALLEEYNTTTVHFRNLASIARGAVGDIDSFREQIETYVSCTGYLDDDDDSDSDSDSNSDSSEPKFRFKWINKAEGLK